MHRPIARAFCLWAVAATLASCATGGITPPPPPVPITIEANVSIYDEAGAPVEDATGVLDLDVAEGDAPIRLTAAGWRQTFRALAPPAHGCWGADLTIASPSYLESRSRVTFCGELSNVILKSSHAWGDEAGWLRREGDRILEESGREWRYRGVTAFQLLKQFCEGQNVDPLIEDYASTGARVFRVFGMFDPWIGSFTLARDDLPRFDACLLGLARTLASHGYRLQFVAFADAQNVMPATSQQRQFLAHVAALIDGEWNLIGELCNECLKNGVDPSAFTEPAGRVLWSRGSGLGGGDPSFPAWDHADFHEARDDEWPRKNECRPYMTEASSPIRGVPCLESEPIGFSETNQPGRRAGVIAGDPESFQRVVEAAGQMGANFGLQNNGGLCHADALIVGGPLGNLQRAACTAFFVGLNFPPTDAHTRPYQRGTNCGDCAGLGDMPIQQLDEFENRAYCRAVGADEWCVISFHIERGRKIRAPIPRAGWRIVEQRAPGLVRLTR